MIRKSLLFLLLTAMVGVLSAQSLRFELNGEALENNAIVLCDSLTPWGEMIQEMEIRNLTDATLEVIVEKEEIQLVEGSQNSFCWGMCYTPAVVVSPVALPILPNSVNDPLEAGLSFHHNIDPNYSGDPSQFLNGTSIVKYYAYPSDNAEDRICVEVWFAYNAEEVSEHQAFVGRAYPNPASSTVSFDVKSTGTLEAVLYNLLGQEVARQTVNGMSQGKLSFDVADLQAGVYFCSFIADGQPWKTEKFIVKK